MKKISVLIFLLTVIVPVGGYAGGTLEDSEEWGTWWNAPNKTAYIHNNGGLKFTYSVPNSSTTLSDYVVIRIDFHSDFAHANNWEGSPGFQWPLIRVSSINSTNSNDKYEMSEFRLVGEDVTVSKSITVIPNHYIKVSVEDMIYFNTGPYADGPVTPGVTLTVVHDPEVYSDNADPKAAPIEFVNAISNKKVFKSNEMYISCKSTDQGRLTDNWPVEHVFADGISQYSIWVDKNTSAPRLYTITYDGSDLSGDSLKKTNVLSEQALLSNKYYIGGTIKDGNLNESSLSLVHFYIDADGPSAPTSVMISTTTDPEGIIIDIDDQQEEVYFNKAIIFSVDELPEDNGYKTVGTEGYALTDEDSGTIVIRGLGSNEVGEVGLNEAISLGNGQYQGSISFNDNLGNKGEEANFTFNIDNTAPMAPIFVTTPSCIPGPNDNTIIYVPTDDQDYIAWEPAVDGTEDEKWQSRTAESSYLMLVTRENEFGDDDLFLTADINDMDWDEDTGVYSTVFQEFENGEYNLDLTASDKVGNIATSLYTLYVDEAPAPVGEVSLEEDAEGEFSLVWDYENGETGYSFDVKILKGEAPLDSDEVWNYDDAIPIEWAEGAAYSCELPDDLRTKVPYTARVYVMNESGFPMYTDYVFHLPNIAAEVSEEMFTVPDDDEIFAPGFPEFGLNGLYPDEEGDQLGLRLYYRRAGTTSYSEADAGAANGEPVLIIDEDTEGTDELGTGVYEWYLAVVEYYEDWDGNLLAWDETVSWPEEDQVFAIDGNAPSGLLSVEDSAEEETITLRAFGFTDGSGATSSGVSAIQFWNDTDMNGLYDSGEYTETTAVGTEEEITIEGWPFEVTDNEVCARMMVIDAVGNRSGAIEISDAEDNAPPVVNLYTTEISRRVGESWSCPADSGFYEASDPEGDDLGWHWDFGDGSESEQQYPEKTYTESGDYTVTLRVSDWWKQSTEVSFTFHANNTTEGELLISESWSGEHVLGGVVIVPAGLSLTIEAGTNVITGEGTGIKARSGAELTISGEAGSVVRLGLSESEENAVFWEGITAEGICIVSYTEIKSAKRGIAAGPGSNVNISGSSFEDSRIGLHIAGASVELVGVNRFIDNLWYGIKEDSMAENGAERPDISECEFSGNENDYYHEEYLNLGADEAKEIIKNEE